MEMIKLSNGIEIPQIGIGVFRTDTGEETFNSVTWALEAGYRHIDTAMAYNNEESVGEAMLKSGLKREEIFLTTKLWNADIRKGRSREAFFESLERLKTDYVDLYLIHWPAEGYVEAYKEMEKLYKEGRIKVIGVSNFKKHHLDEIYKVCEIKPMVNQIESNISFTNDELIDYCKSENIAIEVWSPLGGTGTTQLSEKVLVDLADKYNKSPAQILIRWHMQRDVIVLPKSINKGRIKENIDVFDFELTADEVASITALNKNKRVGSDPDNFNF